MPAHHRVKSLLTISEMRNVSHSDRFLGQAGVIAARRPPDPQNGRKTPPGGALSRSYRANQKKNDEVGF
jgi:hypothetical protein